MPKGVLTARSLALTALAAPLSMILLQGCVAHRHRQPHPNKVAVCHKHRTIWIGEAAVASHLRHGDHRGKCR